MVYAGQLLTALTSLVGSPGLTGTSTAVSEHGEPAPRYAVEARAFSKASRAFVRVGGIYLAREDFWISPGLTLEGGYHFDERWGIDVSSSLYFSTLDAAARQLREQQGFLPEAQQPILRLMAGPRYAFGYGKLLVEDLGVVLHFDLSLALRAGVLVTNRSTNPGGELALAVQVGLGTFLVWLELGAGLGYEDRSTGALVGGPHGAGGFGLRL